MVAVQVLGNYIIFVFGGNNKYFESNGLDTWLLNTITDYLLGATVMKE